MAAASRLVAAALSTSCIGPPLGRPRSMRSRQVMWCSTNTSRACGSRRAPGAFRRSILLGFPGPPLAIAAASAAFLAKRALCPRAQASCARRSKRGAPEGPWRSSPHLAAGPATRERTARGGRWLAVRISRRRRRLACWQGVSPQSGGGLETRNRRCNWGTCSAVAVAAGARARSCYQAPGVAVPPPAWRGRTPGRAPLL